MNRLYFSFVYALIVGSFVGALLTQTWGDSYGIPQKRVFYDKDNKGKGISSATISDRYGSSIAYTNATDRRDSSELAYGRHQSYRDGYGGYSKSDYGERHGYKEHQNVNSRIRDSYALLKKYGKLRAEAWRGPNKVTVYDLVDRWKDYDAYWAGLAVDNPSGVMFDPKGDDRRLISDKWIAVRDQAELSILIRWLKAGSYYPILWRVLDPDNQFYGYIYSPWEHVVLKVVDDQTLWVDDLPLPRFYRGHRRRHFW